MESVTSQEKSNLFNDDQPFQQSAKGTINNEAAKLEISLKAQRSQVKLGQKTILPAMCSIKASGGVRTSVDLICVVDVSGSMSGEKIRLVRQTLNFLIQTLSPSDRLSIITFNDYGKRICGLRTVTQENMVFFSTNVSRLEGNGGTSIASGLELALKTIRDRKVPNKVTSIFLLSDGLDSGADERFNKILKRPENSELGAYSIHSFGFGEDHDQDLMNKICTLKDGSFYFIKELSTLDEAFCNALGGIISMVASDVILQVRCVAAGLVEAVQISKVYDQKWKIVNKGEYQIKLTQIMTDISKDYVFQLTIPVIEGEVGDIVRQHVVVEAIFSAKGLNKEEMSGVAALSLTLINPQQQIAEQLQNIDVIENYLRVKAAEAIEINMEKAEQQKYEQACKGIDMMIENIQGNKKARKEKMEPLMKDLYKIRQKCSQREQYRNQGRKWMVNARQAHRKQGCYQYANHVQHEMVNKRRLDKGGF